MSSALPCRFPQRADLTASLALLEPAHWAALTLRPYGTPHVDLSGWPAAVAVLPAANDEGLTADLLRALGFAPADVARVVDVVGFHEFGHLLMRLYSPSSRRREKRYGCRSATPCWR